MSETPFRVVDINDMWKVVGPTNRPIFEHPLEWISTNRCDLANAAWTAANGPELTRQRDEAVAIVKELEWSRHVRGYGETCPICELLEEQGHAANCRLAAALRDRGE